MTFDTLLSLLDGQPVFDLPTLTQLSGDSRATLRTQLSRWAKSGKIVPLRRGMYALAQHYRSRPINPAELANQLYRPSYLSTEWALGYYGLIPEMVITYTSVSARPPQHFINDLGHFDYRQIKQQALFGMVTTRIQGSNVLLATPEKALLDYWYLNSGHWTPDRMASMRFQHTHRVDQKRLSQAARRFASPRLLRATSAWAEHAAAEQTGTIEL